MIANATGRNCTEGCASAPGDLINCPPVWRWAVGDSRQTHPSQAAASSTALIYAAAFISGWNHVELHCLASAAGFEQGREKQLNLSGGHLTTVPSKNFSIFSSTFQV